MTLIKTDKNIQVFFELLRAGLWEREARLAQYKDLDYAAIMKLAEEQSVVGLITAGLEQVKDVKVPQEWTLQFIGSALQIEQRNKAMNAFVVRLIDLLRKNDIYTLLVKGQGVAQCYERPLWRSCGDIDLLLSKENYKKAKELLLPLSVQVEEEDEKRLHFALSIDSWCVELHGSMHSNLWKKIEDLVDNAQNDVFYNGNVRSWMNGKTQVFLPGIDADTIFIFSHILQHFFLGGIGLRQICDWTRFLWTYSEKIDLKKIEQLIRKTDIMNEWRVFGSLSVNVLGMPEEAMPFFSPSNALKKKSERLLDLVIESGNFGHNRDDSYKKNYSKPLYLLISFWNYAKYSFKQSAIFPMNAFRGWCRVMKGGLQSLIK